MRGWAVLSFDDFRKESQIAFHPISRTNARAVGPSCVAPIGAKFCVSSAAFWIGDWWAFGQHRYGERKKIVQSEEWTGPAFQTCATAASTCQKSETYRRREVLSFEHTRRARRLSPSWSIRRYFPHGGKLGADRRARPATSR